MWNSYSSFEEAEKIWETGSASAAKEHPLKVLKNLPSMPGITEDTKKNFHWKSFKWMVTKDEGFRVLRYTLKKPIKHLFAFLRSLFKKKSYVRDGDFFFYGIKDTADFKKLLLKEDSIFAVGFSYCEKPFECPSGRFTDACIHDATNPVCRQCFIGKCTNALPEKRTEPIFIPTIHYVGEKMFQLIEKYPGKQIVFLITACEMTLEMFGNYGNMAGIKGIGVRLDGRICNTMRAFELSEKGIKPGLTIVLPETERRMLELISFWRETVAK